MDDKKTSELEDKIQDEVNYARAVTALMMAVKADVSILEKNRAEFRLKSSYKSFESDIEKRAS